MTVDIISRSISPKEWAGFELMTPVDLPESPTMRYGALLMKVVTIVPDSSFDASSSGRLGRQ